MVNSGYMPSGFSIVIDAGLVDYPAQPQASFGLPAIARGFAGAPFAILPVAVQLLGLDFDLQIVDNT